VIVAVAVLGENTLASVALTLSGATRSGGRSHIPQRRRPGTSPDRQRGASG
jgi:hypothetical protein